MPNFQPYRQAGTAPACLENASTVLARQTLHAEAIASHGVLTPATEFPLSVRNLRRLMRKHGITPEHFDHSLAQIGYKETGK